MPSTFEGFTLIERASAPLGYQRSWARREHGDLLPVRLTASTTPAPAHFERWTALQFVEHANLLRILDLGAAPSGPWVAEEIVDGLTLRALLDQLRAQNASLPASVIIEIAHKVATGLSHLHQAKAPTGTALNLTHEALSPEQVLLERQGRVVLDGLALTAASPEIPDPRGDVWGLGRLMAEMVLGHAPIDSDPNALALVLSKRSDLPNGLPELIAELCHPDLEQRPQRMELLVPRLARLGEGLQPASQSQAYIAHSVQTLKPGLESVQAKLLYAFRAAGHSYPPVEEEASAAPALQLPVPTSPAPLSAAPAIAPQIKEGAFDVAPKPMGAADLKPTWQGGVQAEPGPPLWLMIGGAVLCLVGAVSLARMIMPSDAPDEPRPRATTRAAPPAQKFRQLDVTSVPAGADVYVDGKKRGRTPLEIADLKPGSPVTVFVKLRGYKDVDPLTVQILPNTREVKTAHFVLQRLLTLSVSSEPPGATVQISGRKATGTTPYEITRVEADEALEITFTKPGFLPRTVKTTATAQTQIPPVKLVPARLFSFRSEPDNAEVQIDGESVGRTPLIDWAIEAGRSFELTISRPDTSTYRRKLTAKNKSTQQIKATLKPLPWSKLDLMPSERDDYARIRDTLKQSSRDLRQAKAKLSAAKRKLASFERQANINVDELEQAQEKVDAAETVVLDRSTEHNTNRDALNELRQIVVRRLLPAN